MDITDQSSLESQDLWSSSSFSDDEPAGYYESDGGGPPSVDIHGAPQQPRRQLPRPYYEPSPPWYESQMRSKPAIGRPPASPPKDPEGNRLTAGKFFPQHRSNFWDQLEQEDEVVQQKSLVSATQMPRISRTGPSRFPESRKLELSSPTVTQPPVLGKSEPIAPEGHELPITWRDVRPAPDGRDRFVSIDVSPGLSVNVHERRLLILSDTGKPVRLPKALLETQKPTRTTKTGRGWRS